MSRSTWKLGALACCAFSAILTLATAAHAEEPAKGGGASTEETQAQARRQFEAGVALLDDPDGAKYEDAYHAFRKAYELSQSPAVLGNIAFCAFHLERDGEAIDAYTAYLRDAPQIDDKERGQIQRDLSTLTATAAKLNVTVKAPAGSYVLVDKRTQTRGAAVENAYPFTGTEFAVRMRPGRHTLVVKNGDAVSSPIDVTLEPGSTSSQSLTFPLPSSRDEGGGAPRKPGSIVGPIILGAVGLVGIGVGVTTGLMAKSKTNGIEDSCPNDTCPAAYDLDGNRSKAKTLGTIADISFVGGGVLLGGAIVWYLLLPKGSPTRGSADPHNGLTAWLPTAGCSRLGCGFQLERGF